jgi:hypothetical protein
VKVGDLVKHRIVYGLGTGVVVRSWPHPTVDQARVLWSKYQNIGPTLENIVSLELISENR